jgi:small-conductance mechanosensitive channel
MMALIAILVAGIAGFAFGALWYTVFAKQWMQVSGVPLEGDKPANQSDPVPYITGLVGTILVAGMLAHVFRSSGVDGALSGLVSGLGAGAFIAAPWLATCYGFAARPKRLVLIDCGYAIGGAGTIGLVLGLF